MVNLNAEWTRDPSYLGSSAGYLLYDGVAFKERAMHTILRGDFIMRGRQLIDAVVGQGRYMPRRLSPAVLGG